MAVDPEPETPGATPVHCALDARAIKSLDVLLAPGGVLIPGRDDVTRYETDVLGRQGKACWVARPSDTADVRRVMRWAFSERARFVVQGANTGPVGAGIPRSDGTQGVLTMERCRHRLDIDAVNRTVTASAGVDLAAVNEALAPYGLVLPIDLGANPSVGGMVGANTGGARLIRHGDVRRHLLGLEVVLPDEDATVLPMLKGLRKDNRGPDLKQLFVASSGTLGVITAAVFSVDRLPKQVAVALVAVTGGPEVLALLALLEARAIERLAAFELLSRTTLEAIARHLPDGVRWPLANRIPELVVLVELATAEAAEAGRPGLDEELATILDQGSRGGLVEDAWFGPPDQLWAIRHGAIDALAREGPMIAFDLCTPRSRLFELRDRAVALVDRLSSRARYADFGHVGDGGLHVVIIWPDEVSAGEREREARELSAAMYDLVSELEGTFSAEHGVGPENEVGFRTHTPAAVRALHGALKSVLDPRGLLGVVDLS